MDAKAALRVVRRSTAGPLLLGYYLTNTRELIDADVSRWQSVRQRPETGRAALLRCLSEPTHEFRNLFYHRLQHGSLAGKLLAPALRMFFTPEKTLFLDAKKIGPGLFIQHGFATIVFAESIGANCWINQQVTIGLRAGPVGETPVPPTLMDGATVCAGAKVLGNTVIGTNAVVGANAVVVKDVPDGMVAVGIPATNRPAGPHSRNR